MHVSAVLLLTMDFITTLSISLRIHSAVASWLHSYFDNIMTKFMINNRADAWKTDVNLLSREVTAFALLRCTIGLKKWRHFLIQSEAK